MSAENTIRAVLFDAGGVLVLPDPGQLVVVLTGAGEDELGVEALRAGAVDAVPKDTDLDVLARALAAARRVEAPIAHAAE